MADDGVAGRRRRRPAARRRRRRGRPCRRRARRVVSRVRVGAEGVQRGGGGEDLQRGGGGAGGVAVVVEEHLAGDGVGDDEAEARRGRRWRAARRRGTPARRRRGRGRRGPARAPPRAQGAGRQRDRGVRRGRGGGGAGREGPGDDVRGVGHAVAGDREDGDERGDEGATCHPTSRPVSAASCQHDHPVVRHTSAQERRARPAGRTSQRPRGRDPPRGAEEGKPWSSTSRSRSRRGTATSTRWTTRRAASGSTGCCSPPRATPTTTASSRAPSARTATRWTPSCSSRSRRSPAASSAAGRSGMFRMRDEAGGDDKVLCVPAGDQRASWRTEIDDVSEFHRLEIQHFFEVYKDLEPGKSVEGAHWVGPRGGRGGDPQVHRARRGDRLLQQRARRADPGLSRRAVPGSRRDAAGPGPRCHEAPDATRPRPVLPSCGRTGTEPF